jgi:flap endonuclease-1
LGLPVIQAPSEGEAQASFMIEKGEGYGIVSEDFDSILFGAPKVIRGLSITQRKKQKDVLGYKKTEIEIIHLDETLNHLGINQEKLIALGMIIGTDFNPGGIKGIGPVNALKIVKRCKDLNEIFKEVNWDFHFNYPWQDVFNIFNSKDYNEYELKWQPIDEIELKDLLMKKFEFSEKSIDTKLKNLDKAKQNNSQTGLNQFL